MPQYLNQVTKFTLPESGTILMPFDAEAAVASLPVFCANSGQQDIIRHLLEFLEDGDYTYQFISRACPTTEQQGGSNVILANQSFEDQISVPAGSFLTMIGGISQVSPNVYGRFRVKLYDAGAQASITQDWANAFCMSGKFTQLPQTGTGMLTTVDENKNLFILPSPLAITSPGQLNVQITNLEAETVTIDMAFFFATPIEGYNPIDPAWVGNAVNR
jgi:hypothetical protein